MLPHSTAVKPQGCQLLFCKLFSFWQRKKLIKLPIFCDEILSGKELPSGMTVGGGGACADGYLCGIGILTREINDLPYKREWAARTDGAVYGIGIFTREINDLPYEWEWAVRADMAIYETNLGGTRVSLLGEKPLRRRTNARSARLPHARSSTNNQKWRKPFRRADSSEGYRGLPR